MNILEFTVVCCLMGVIGGVIAGVIGGPVAGGIGVVGGAIVGALFIVVEQLYTIIGLLGNGNTKEIQRDIK